MLMYLKCGLLATVLTEHAIPYTALVDYSQSNMHAALVEHLDPAKLTLPYCWVRMKK